LVDENGDTYSAVIQNFLCRLGISCALLYVWYASASNLDCYVLGDLYSEWCKDGVWSIL
jgi:hypothetical protein